MMFAYASVDSLCVCICMRKQVTGLLWQPFVFSPWCLECHVCLFVCLCLFAPSSSFLFFSFIFYFKNDTSSWCMWFGCWTWDIYISQVNHAHYCMGHDDFYILYILFYIYNMFLLFLLLLGLYVTAGCVKCSIRFFSRYWVDLQQQKRCLYIQSCIWLHADASYLHSLLNRARGVACWAASAFVDAYRMEWK